MLIDCAVVGAGPAGLAASAALTARGVEHVVLERAASVRAGEFRRAETVDDSASPQPLSRSETEAKGAPLGYLAVCGVVPPGWRLQAR
jgi:flavin-dependent dehydrogenase